MNSTDSDLELQQDAMDELSLASSIASGDLGVTASNGVVRLTGHANSEGERLTAERAISRLAGVTAIRNDIEVTRRRMGPYPWKLWTVIEEGWAGLRTGDGCNEIELERTILPVAIRAEIEAAIDRECNVDDAKAIVVTVVDRKVTLSGTLHSWSAYDTVRRLAWGASGVADVIDHIDVTPGTSAL